MFETLVGQERIKASLEKLLTQKVYPHATVFYGNEGSQLLETAIETAALLVSNGQQDTPAYRNARSMIHPDVHYSIPVAGSKVTSDDVVEEWRNQVKINPELDLRSWASIQAKENSQLNINTKEVSSIIRKLGFKSFEGGARVLIIWGAEKLGREGNKLLKLIEEPPENTFIILLTNKLEDILPTILSRCQSFYFRPLGQSVLVEWMVSKGKVDENKAQEIARMSDGNLGLVKKLIDANETSEGINLEEWIFSIRSSNFEKVLTWITQFSRLGRESQKNFLLQSIALLKTEWSSKTKGSDRLQGKNLFIQGETRINERFERLNNIFVGAIEELERNGNSKVVMMSKSLKIWDILNIK